MTGLEKEIEKRREGRTNLSGNFLSYSGISKVIGCSYPTAKRKVRLNSFTVREALTIFERLFKTSDTNKFDAFTYLFTIQE